MNHTLIGFFRIELRLMIFAKTSARYLDSQNVKSYCVSVNTSTLPHKYHVILYSNDRFTYCVIIIFTF